MNLSFKKYVKLSVCLSALLMVTACGSEKKYSYQKKKKPFQTTTVTSRYGGGSGEANLRRKFAQILGVAVTDIRNRRLYQFINEWLGTPYQYGGLSKSGVDCSGFSKCLFKEVYNVFLPRGSYQQGGIIKRKNVNDLKEGDLVFFRFGSKKIDHVGIYLQNGKFVHASTSKGVVISNLADVWYKKVYVQGGGLN